jgi:hypothetical protein
MGARAAVRATQLNAVCVAWSFTNATLARIANPNLNDRIGAAGADLQRPWRALPKHQDRRHGIQVMVRVWRAVMGHFHERDIGKNASARWLGFHIVAFVDYTLGQESCFTRGRNELPFPLPVRESFRGRQSKNRK